MPKVIITNYSTCIKYGYSYAAVLTSYSNGFMYFILFIYLFVYLILNMWDQQASTAQQMGQNAAWGEGGITCQEFGLGDTTWPSGNPYLLPNHKMLVLCPCYVAD